MVEEANGCGRGNHKLPKPIAMINQTIFSNYHRFGSSATIFFDEAQNGHTEPEGSQERRPAAGGEKIYQVAPAVSGPNMRP